MFTNLEGCTFYEKIESNRAPDFVRHVTGRVYCEETFSGDDGRDRAPHRRVYICIPDGETDYIPRRGDRAVTCLSDAEKPPADALTVLSVSDRRYGSKRVRHIEVNAG